MLCTFYIRPYKPDIYICIYITIDQLIVEKQLHNIIKNNTKFLHGNLGVLNNGRHANCSSLQECGSTICGDDGAYVFLWVWEESEEDLIPSQR